MGTFVMYVATRLNAVYSLEKSNMGDGEEGQRMLEQHLTRIGPKIGGHQAAKVAAVASYEGEKMGGGGTVAVAPAVGEQKEQKEQKEKQEQQEQKEQKEPSDSNSIGSKVRSPSLELSASKVGIKVSNRVFPELDQSGKGDSLGVASREICR